MPRRVTRCREKRGGRRWAGPGFGFDITRRVLKPNHEEQAIIAQIQAWREGGLSYRDIASMLTTSGVPTKRGGVWRPTTVHQLVRRASVSA